MDRIGTSVELFSRLLTYLLMEYLTTEETSVELLTSLLLLVVVDMSVSVSRTSQQQQSSIVQETTANNVEQPVVPANTTQPQPRPVPGEYHCVFMLFSLWYQLCISMVELEAFYHTTIHPRSSWHPQRLLIVGLLYLLVRCCLDSECMNLE